MNELTACGNEKSNVDAAADAGFYGYVQQNTQFYGALNYFFLLELFIALLQFHCALFF